MEVEKVHVVVLSPTCYGYSNTLIFFNLFRPMPNNNNNNSNNNSNNASFCCEERKQNACVLSLTSQLFVLSCFAINGKWYILCVCVRVPGS